MRQKPFLIKLAPTLNKDVFELSAKKEAPDVLSYSPNIIEGMFNSGIKDPRLKEFRTDFRAYNFEGHDIEFPTKYICIDSEGERRLKPHVYLSYVEVKPEFARQGAYSNAIKHLVGVAKEDKECEGRIILSARKIIKKDVTKIPSPSIAHWKCGFRFTNEEDNKIMCRIMNGELPPNKAPEGYMYYAFI